MYALCLGLKGSDSNSEFSFAPTLPSLSSRHFEVGTGTSGWGCRQAALTLRMNTDADVRWLALEVLAFIAEKGDLHTIIAVSAPFEDNEDYGRWTPLEASS